MNKELKQLLVAALNGVSASANLSAEDTDKAAINALLKDLKAQKGSVRISVLINMALVAYVYLNASVMAKELGGELACSWVAVLPIAAIVLQFMAFRAVKRDIKLLSDSDRIR